MKTLNYVKILLLYLITMTLASCGDDVYYTMQSNSDDKLCNKTWTEEYSTSENEYCKHELKFAGDRSGREFFLYYRAGDSRPYKENTFSFTWRWIDSDMENMEINYGAGDVLFFDNVWVREHNLSGKFDGEVVMFVDANYYK